MNLCILNDLFLDFEFENLNYLGLIYSSIFKLKRSNNYFIKNYIKKRILILNLEKSLEDFNFTLNFSNFINLEYLNVSDNNLQYLDLRDLQKLKFLDCSINFIYDIKISPNLKFLYCGDNCFSSLYIDKAHILKCLVIFRNEIVDLIIPYNIRVLTMRDTKLESLDIGKLFGDKKFRKLNYLEIDDNYIDNLNLKFAPNLKYLSCQGNLLKNLDLKCTQRLITCNCCINDIHTIKMDNVLECLDCRYNPIKLSDLKIIPNLVYYTKLENNKIRTKIYERNIFV